MASAPPEILYDYTPMFIAYKDGRIHRLSGEDFVPPSTNPTTGVQSKDVEFSAEPGVMARLFLPNVTSKPPVQKLPVLVYFHGGGFVVSNATNALYHNYMESVVAEANVVAVSVNYRKAPEFPLPTGYEDSWAAVKWVVSHAAGEGEDAWLNEYGDFQRVFFGGDSAGANIAHNMALRVGSEVLGTSTGTGFNLEGMFLVNPYFWGEELVGGENAMFKPYMENLWRFVNPSTMGCDNPAMNPSLDPNLSKLGCRRVLVCVAEKDVLKDRGWFYHQVLGKCGWGGEVEVLESKGEQHVFHLYNPSCENAVAMMKRIVSFLNQ